MSWTDWLVFSDYESVLTRQEGRVAALIAGDRLDEIDPPKSTPKAKRSRTVELGEKLLAIARLADLTATAVQSALSALKSRSVDRNM